MLILVLIKFSCALHFHGGQRSIDWSRPVQTFGREEQKAVAKSIEPKICRMRRDLIGWNRQQNHLLRRLARTRDPDFGTRQLLRVYSNYAHRRGIC